VEKKSHMDRSSAWKAIWDKKGLNKEGALHSIDGFDLLSNEGFDNMVAEVTRPIGLTGNESLLECGCGAGAFLASLLRQKPGLNVCGIDYSLPLIQIAREYVTGNFLVADMTNLGFFASSSFDHVISFSAIFYLSSEEAAQRAVSEMLRISKPGGTVYIGDVPDAAKRDKAALIRQLSHQAVKRISQANPDHLYLPKTFFEDIAHVTGSGLKILDHDLFTLGDYQAAKYRYSAYFTKRG
jgi:ubiquinone/menaquinone biosynthesis C-methylase UbiE